MLPRSSPTDEAGGPSIAPEAPHDNTDLPGPSTRARSPTPSPPSTPDFRLRPRREHADIRRDSGIDIGQVRRNDLGLLMLHDQADVQVPDGWYGFAFADDGAMYLSSMGQGVFPTRKWHTVNVLSAGDLTVLDGRIAHVGMTNRFWKETETSARQSARMMWGFGLIDRGTRIIYRNNSGRLEDFVFT